LNTSHKSSVQPEIVPATLAYQPTTRQEFSQDRNRFADAISLDPDKYRLIEPYLMDYEQPIAVAVQRQFPFSLFADIVLLSTHRLLIFRRFFTKVDMLDVNYVDLEDVTVKQGFFTSALGVSTASGRYYTISALVTDQALNVYRRCQDIETKARIARRQFKLEENRSNTMQLNINNNLAGAVPPGLTPEDQFRLGHRDRSRIGVEEIDPFLLSDE